MWKKETRFCRNKSGLQALLEERLSSAFDIWRLSTADHKLASKKRFVREFFNRSPSFLERRHLDERESFRALGILVADHLSVTHLADPVKEIEQVAFGGVER
jgi:hypothetical protein